MNKNQSFWMDVWNLIKARRAWWLAPIIIMLFLVGIVIIAGQSSAISPFIYTLF